MKVFEHFLRDDNTIDVLSSQCVWDYALFYRPVERPFDYFEVKNETKRISEILLALDLVPTRTWCRKNNWDWEILEGYQEVIFGSKRIKLCILINPPPRYTVEEIDEFERLALIKGE